ncbi:MAG: hypothetical protein WCT99_07985 [Bacteroidota bacterium]
MITAIKKVITSGLEVKKPLSWQAFGGAIGERWEDCPDFGFSLERDSTEDLRRPIKQDSPH